MTLKEIENNIGYTFKEKSLLSNALTHSSYANEKRIASNERLEFLGDSVLGVVISEYIYKRLNGINEGDLSKLRASIVCETSLFKAAKRIGLDEALRLGNGEEQTGGRKRPSIVSDAFEAVIAAIYLDDGLETAREWVLSHTETDIEEAISGKRNNDYKTTLQEKIQKSHIGEVSYELIRESGLDHNKTFVMGVYVNDEKLGEGEGQSKKEAQQQAAKYALENMK
ncbi:MAG: ribonuclease III [Clostridia bacterium]|nr:ribonuclease III [Clostridia bacterium]